MDEAVGMSLLDFQKYIEAIIEISNDISDDWKININESTENNKYLTKKLITFLQNPEEPDLNLLASIEYHVVYNISYSVPVLCFNICRQNGTRISLEEYWKCNKNLQDYDMLDTLTQMDHPVLNRPIFTLHPCKTQEILQGFLKSSKNPIISWLSVVGRFVHLEILDEYLKNC